MSHPSIQEIYCTMSKILTIIIRKKIKIKKKPRKIQLNQT